MGFVSVCVAIETPRVCVWFLLESIVEATSSLPFPLIPARLMAKWTPLTFQRLPPSWLLTHYTPWRAIAVPLTAAQIGWKRCLWRALWSAELLLSRARSVSIPASCSRGQAPDLSRRTGPGGSDKLPLTQEAFCAVRSCVCAWLPEAMSDTHMVCIVSGNWVYLLYPDFM